ncbi:Alginate lyase 2 [Catenulispora acidiphila DSM 44928]|uniref:Alginate lyase 2 n=1 Tax=Catenulispora acidiphila (strain DSM 44928 / JCM 14897 / NBRC 102108 / NRRL B-24433 / ID139908) TaxID=479433 RepID=C7QBF0_CATAD|nr:polysaccharide lyase family 7 protein [Catenulispora acidiphila]ACU70527.1 Alginate lyase 2 [Catenulispora acidiphila DSM 44928]
MLRGASPKLVAAATAATVVLTGAVIAASSTAAQAAPAVTRAAAPKLSTTVAPGGNFNLSVWELQEPVGSPGSPRTIPSAQLQGAKGYQDSYFYTDTKDGAMTFWAPEKGVTTPNSNYARSELREMNTDGSSADWKLAGSHQLQATLRVDSVTDHVCVGQIHLGTGGSSTKPLVELYYYKNGNIVLGEENSPSGGQTTHQIANVPVGTQWSYTIAVSGGNTINLTVNGKTTKYAIPSSFNAYHMYFKAGSYNQSSSSSTTKGARVAFYALTVKHS